MNATFKNISIALSTVLALGVSPVFSASDTDEAVNVEDAIPQTVEACLQQVEKMKADGVENTDEFEAACIENVEAMNAEGAEQPVQPAE